MRAFALTLSIALVGCATQATLLRERAQTPAMCGRTTSNDATVALDNALSTEPLRRAVHPNTTMTETRGVRVLVRAQRGQHAAYLERAMSCAVAEAPLGHPLDGVEIISVRKRGGNHEIQLETTTGSAGRALHAWTSHRAAAALATNESVASP